MVGYACTDCSDSLCIPSVFLQAELADRDRQITDRDRQIAEHARQIADRDRQIAEFHVRCTAAWSVGVYWFLTSDSVFRTQAERDHQTAQVAERERQAAQAEERERQVRPEKRVCVVAVCERWRLR